MSSRASTGRTFGGRSSGPAPSVRSRSSNASSMKSTANKLEKLRLRSQEPTWSQYILWGEKKKPSIVRKFTDKVHLTKKSKSLMQSTMSGAKWTGKEGWKHGKEWTAWGSEKGSEGLSRCWDEANSVLPSVSRVASTAPNVLSNALNWTTETYGQMQANYARGRGLEEKKRSSRSDSDEEEDEEEDSRARRVRRQGASSRRRSSGLRKRRRKEDGDFAEDEEDSSEEDEERPGRDDGAEPSGRRRGRTINSPPPARRTIPIRSRSDTYLADWRASRPPRFVDRPVSTEYLRDTWDGDEGFYEDPAREEWVQLREFYQPATRGYGGRQSQSDSRRPVEPWEGEPRYSASYLPRPTRSSSRVYSNPHPTRRNSFNDSGVELDDDDDDDEDWERDGERTVSREKRPASVAPKLFARGVTPSQYLTEGRGRR